MSAQRLRCKWHERYQQQKKNINPQQVTIRTLDILKLRLMTHPVNAKLRETHRIGQQYGTLSFIEEQRIQYTSYITCRHSCEGIGQMDVEYQQGHSDRENTVSECLNTTLP